MPGSKPKSAMVSKKRKLLEPKKNEKIVVAISAKNEQDTIRKCINSVIASLKHGDLNADIVVCANECTDNTVSEVQKCIESNPDQSISLIVTDKGGLIRSQRLIVSSYFSDIYVFVDADTYITPDSIEKLVNGLRDGVIVTYASTKLPPVRKSDKLVTKLYYLYNSGRMLQKRQYFHGRFFATREWSVPSDTTVAKQARLRPELYKFGGLLVDDIYLSAFIIHKHGVGSIKEIEDAIVFASPISKFSDWWRTYRRTRIEVLKVITWFPEFQLYKKYLFRKTNWSAVRREKVYIQLKWMIYLLTVNVYKLLLLIELFSIKYLKLRHREQWLRVNSTKDKPLSSDKLIFFDLDETLVSADKQYFKKPEIKKKVAELISKDFIVGINTNRVLSGAIGIYKALGLNGPIIAEGGAVSYLPKDKNGFEELIPNKRKENNLKERVGEVIQAYLKKSGHLYSYQDKSSFKAGHDASNLHIVVSDERRYTVSIYIHDNGELSDYWAGRLMEVLTNNLGKHGVIIEHGAQKGKLHIYYPDSNKVSTASIIRDKLYSESTLYIIGDDEATEGKRPDDTYYIGVQQSAEQYRILCTYVAKKPGAEGLKQIINYVLET